MFVKSPSNPHSCWRLRNVSFFKLTRDRNLQDLESPSAHCSGHSFLISKGIMGVDPSPYISVALYKTTDSHNIFSSDLPIISYHIPLQALHPLPCGWETLPWLHIYIIYIIGIKWIPMAPQLPTTSSWSDNSISEVPFTSTKVSRSRSPG